MDRLFLLNPGFDLPGRFPQVIGAARFAEFKRAGVLWYPDARGVEAPVPFSFYEDAAAHRPFPPVNTSRCPTVVLHGTNDTVVPIGTSLRWAAMQAGGGGPAAVVVPVADDHALTAPASLETMCDLATSHFLDDQGPPWRLVGSWEPRSSGGNSSDGCNGSGDVIDSSSSGSLRVELLQSGDVVARPPPLFASDVLVNSANERLEGTRRPLFPVGGPCPAPPPPDVQSSQSSWGGMDVGPGLLYATQTVDGRVTAEGGAGLRRELSESFPAGCAVGDAVATRAHGRLGKGGMGYRPVWHALIVR